MRHKKYGLIAAMVVLAIAFLGCVNLPDKQDHLKLWYDAPARDWNEALPIGNGRLGAMVFGNPDQENIQLNENTLWAGGPHRNDNPAAKEAFEEIRKLMFQNKYQEAHDLANAKIISKNSHGMPYETLGNLRLHFSGHNEFSNYYRELDIDNAIAKTSYMVDGVLFQREVFTSFTDQVLVIRITANKKSKISFSAGMDRPAPAEVMVSSENHGILAMTGTSSDRRSNRLPENQPPIKGRVAFEARLKIVPEGGSLTRTDSSLAVTGANSATLYVSMATNFVNYRDISADAHQIARNHLAKAEKKTYRQLVDDHTSYYQHFFKRVIWI